MKKSKVKRKARSVRGSVNRPNVFEQLGFDSIEAAALERKSALYAKVVDMAQRLGLTQGELATLLGITQPHVSQLLGGKISRFSVEKLIEFAVRLGAEVKIVVQNKAG